MASITIRDIPERTYAEFAARAARSGRSMEEYLRIKLLELTSMPEREEVLGRIVGRLERTSTDVSAEQVLAARDVDRR